MRFACVLAGNAAWRSQVVPAPGVSVADEAPASSCPETPARRRNAASIPLEATGLGQGYVSRIVRSLEEHGYLEGAASRISVASPRALLTDWAAHDDSSRHEIVHGHSPLAMTEVPASSFAEALRPPGSGMRQRVWPVRGCSRPSRAIGS